MKRWVLGIAAASAAFAAQAVIPAILLEACNSFDQPSKRMECLKAANDSERPHGRLHPGTPSAIPQAAFATPAPSATPRAASTRNSGGATCHVGPRGGTYTITASGRKNYGGC